MLNGYMLRVRLGVGNFYVVSTMYTNLSPKSTVKTSQSSFGNKLIVDFNNMSVLDIFFNSPNVHNKTTSLSLKLVWQFLAYSDILIEKSQT